jgi:5-methyltetrahydropteroyltriglutamate--homocysteine methyltransferase
MLARPPDLVELLQAASDTDVESLDRRVREAVIEVVQRQVELGIDSVNDGEYGKRGYMAYIPERMSGFGPAEGPHPVTNPVRRDFPEYFALASRQFGGGTPQACKGPLGWEKFSQLERDIESLREAADKSSPREVFMTTVSPGNIALLFPNEYYPTQEAYLEAIAALMQEEYEAIHAAGFQLQIACPDLAMSRNARLADKTLEEFRQIAALHVDVLNQATRNIPPDDMSIHLCWGGAEAPHHVDVPLVDIVDIVLRARPSGLNLTAANPRHEHEWKVWRDVELPPGKVLIPGVIDTTTNFVEHPEVVADRLIRYAGVVGRENVVAGIDCGFQVNAGDTQVDARVSWAKLQSLVEGAKLASTELWAS